MKEVPLLTLDELIEAGVIELGRGKIISKKDIAAYPGPYPIYSSAKENDGKFGEYGQYMFDEELITWSVDGGGRLFHRPKHKFSVTNVGGTLRILNSSSLDYRYLYYALTIRHAEIAFDWVLKAHPSTIRKLYKNIPVPPLSEQHRIVAILDEAFDGIATAKANAEKNLQNARALFESYLQSVFTERGEEWPRTTLGDAYDVRDGTHDSPKFYDEGFPLVTSKNLKRDGLSFDSIKFISEADYRKINERSGVSVGDVLFAMIGTIGNPVVVQDGPNFAIKNMALFKVPKNQSSEFLRYFLSADVTLTRMKSEANGTTQKFVGLGYLRKFPIRLPSFQKQHEIVGELDQLSTETDCLESLYQQKLTALDDLKKSLLHQAFSGQL